MRLERIEINGFKSFSDRSELAFDKGVTAIVGPNGCGKSNVADAITWVMGEQSAKSLRGERMEDVLFSGSDARKPTASAEVRLRFSGVAKTVSGPALPAPGDDAAPERHDGRGPQGNGHGSGPNGNGHSGNPHQAHGSGNGREPVPFVVPGLARPDAIISRAEAEELIQAVAREVEVTRRLYRSGESEYLIDGEVCRLRDVHELLMDTGLGAKAYAIIEQGKIGLILSSRPTDRRQLIEEAAGVTRYKARRRAADLKLTAARENLIRIDDIVFEVDKQRGTLRRQAAKARRYQKLRDELRRCEKVLLARKYRQLAETIVSARAQLADARLREAAATAQVAEVDAHLSRLRIELVEAESKSTTTREAAHACELTINRQQQQITFDDEQVRALETRITAIVAEAAALDARREPAQAALEARRAAAADASAERDRAAALLAAGSEAYDSAHREIEGLEADVEAARSEVFSAINAATALRHAIEHAGATRDRVGETLSKLDVELNDARLETERVAAEHAAAADAFRRAQLAIEETRIARGARDSELASARIEHEWRARLVRSGEHELAGVEARLRSLEELEAARAGYDDAARTLLAQANGQVDQKGAVADYLEVDPGYERAVEACLGDLLQHVIVDLPEHAAAGFSLVRAAGAGRCGFLIAGMMAGDGAAPADVATRPGGPAATGLPDGVVALSSIVHLDGPYADAIAKAIGDAWIADSYDSAASTSGLTTLPVVTSAGDVFRGPHLVSGGLNETSRGILETKGEIKALRGRVQSQADALARLATETDALDATIVQASNAIAALAAEHHKQEKAMVAQEAQLQRALDEAARLSQKTEQLSRERGQAEEEREAIDRRQAEARESIARLETDQRTADDQLAGAQRRLFEAREAAENLSHRAAEARADHAALVERAVALAAEVVRLQEAGAELEARAGALAAERDETRRRIDELHTAIAAGSAKLDVDVIALERLKQEVRDADDTVLARRASADEHELVIKDHRVTLEAVRAVVADLDLARATAEGDLSHLAATSVELLQATIDEVVLDVEELERQGGAAPDSRVVCAAEGAGSDDTEETEEARDADGGAAVAVATERALSAEEAITTLKARIDRLGPVNMMAIEQFDELESRHAFLTTQRADLVESIAQTSEAIRRIDETTRQRFAEAFTAINRNFQETFGTLFGGGRAGLTLLDENDPLESGIEIIAQPPGKRLQSVQLLSGGEKALTAIALMFALFKFKPSPFCLLDEIDAPLDDANIGRFVEMLRSMQRHTQFILITHNRKTMEIADRLYGVTMEEPGVSKLISVQLN
jgi:chromosome segregation protein